MMFRDSCAKIGDIMKKNAPFLKVGRLIDADVEAVRCSYMFLSFTLHIYRTLMVQ